jgi:aspartyl-tRNA(Asn)/glutamyl-tRNA(Gln) amidotransferase subunit C
MCGGASLYYRPVAPLSIADVERIAALAHLNLSDEEKALFSKQLADVLGLAAQLQAVDTTGVEATAHVLALTDTERADEPKPSLTPQQATANAPDAEREAGLFRVPRVIGG